MELIILGIILFIVGIGATFLYDLHVKATADRAAIRAANPPRARVTTPKPAVSNPLAAPTHDYDALIRQIKARAQRGETHIRVQPTGQREQTMTVQELIKRLEQMKKNV